MSESKITEKKNFLASFLDAIERVGNKLPAPAMLFFYGMILVWISSFLLSRFQFSYLVPKTGQPVVVQNLLTGDSLANFFATLVPSFMSFGPLGIVIVAMLGIGVAERSGFLNTAIKKLLNMTPSKLLTPIVIFVGMLSHVASDAGYVLVIPIGAMMFYSVGRHPVVGLAAAFAGVSGGFAASIVPNGNDALLQSFTQQAAQLYDPSYEVNVLANWFFGIGSTFFLVLVGWWVTEKVVEPRFKNVSINSDVQPPTDLSQYSAKERKAFIAASWVMLLGIVLLFAVLLPEASPFRDAETGLLTSYKAAAMQSIVAFIFVLFIIPGIVYGYIAGTFSSSNDVMQAMSESMSALSSYIIMVFFCAMFVKAFNDSNIGTLVALSGADLLKSMNLPAQITIIGMIVLTAVVNLMIGSASAKWALLSPIMVPVLMGVGISPELTQAAYRVGDSTTNIISPLMLYFPLVMMYMQQYIRNASVGSLVSLMLPYSVVFLISWIGFLLLWWGLDLPLGINAPYTYPN
ncbi:AbgT family transporter [Pseudomonas sp. F1_0610]|uniref:AbgT family transporter n=1 Tax=Pseudomonas sp. F1_0610 TaxID=3114284 RepID=UPI0039C45DE6